jgi:sugar phosphate permease
VFATFTFAFTAYSTWAPTYLNQELGIDLETANFDASLTSLAIIPSTIVAGWILDRTKRRGLVLAAALLASGLLLSWSFRLGDPGVVAPFFVALGCVAGFIPTTAFTLAPETMPRPELAGLALGILSVGQNLGLFFGPPAIAAVIADGNWGAGVIPLVASLAVGVIAVWLLPARRAGSG